MNGDKHSATSISQQFDRARFLNIIKYYLNWRCDMENQVDCIKPQPSAAKKEAHQQMAMAAQRNNDPDQIHSSGLQNQNCAIGEEVLANLTVADRQKLMNGGPFRMPKALRSDMTVIIIEILPEILISDSHNFMEAIFTKESINDFRRNYGNMKFSGLRDKAIQVSKWRLQIDFVDSNKVFNSYNNMTIKLVIEQFFVYKNETLPQKTLRQAQPVFKDLNVQTLIKNHRHWFSQNLLKKQCLSFQDLIDEQSRLEQSMQRGTQNLQQNVFNDIYPSQFELPSLKEVVENNPACSTGIQNSGVNSVAKANTKQTKKRMLRSSADSQINSKSTKGMHDENESKEESMQEDEESTAQNQDNLNFGGIIQKTQVFRFQARNFPDVRNSISKMFDLRTDIESDLTEYVEQLQLKKAFQSQNLRINEMERLIIQEKGEQFYAEKKATKLRLWREQVEDEQRRTQLKIQIEYFQIGNSQTTSQNGFGTGGTANTYETLFKKDKDNATGQKIPGFRSTRRIIGYTLGRSAASVKRNLLRLLDSSKTADDPADNGMKSKLGAAASPQKGRPRFNSQENILQLRNVEDSQKTQMTQMQASDNAQGASIPKPIVRHYSRKREPLSQYIVNPNSVLDDTESEKDSFQEQLQKEIQNEAGNNQHANKLQAEFMAPKIDNVVQNVNMHRDMFKAYLTWFESNHVALKSKFDKLTNAAQPEDSQASQQSFNNLEPSQLATKDQTRIVEQIDQIDDLENQQQSQFVGETKDVNMNLDIDPIQEPESQKIIQDHENDVHLAQIDGSHDNNGVQQDQEMSIQGYPQAEHQLQLQELVDINNHRASPGALNLQPNTDILVPNTSRPLNHHFPLDAVSNYTAIPMASMHDPTESNLEDPSNSQNLTSTHQMDQRTPYTASVAGSNFNQAIDDKDLAPAENYSGLGHSMIGKEDLQMEDQRREVQERQSQGEAEEVSGDRVSQGGPEAEVGDQESVSNYVQPIALFYRPPFVLPEEKEQNFLFIYDKTAPIPPRPLDQMNDLEKELFEAEMEEYEADRQQEKARQKREFIKLKQQLRLIKQQIQQQEQLERNKMEAEEQLSRAYQQEQRQKEIEENMRIEQERQRVAEEAKRKLEEEEQARCLRMRQEEIQRLKEQEECAPEGQNEELDWQEGESFPQSQNQSQRSNQVAQKASSPQSLRSQQQSIRNGPVENNADAEIEDGMHQSENQDSNVQNPDNEPSEADNENESIKNERLSFTESEALRQQEQREAYIQSMQAKFRDQIDDGIKRNIHSDLKMRDAGNHFNEDRIFDEAKQMSLEKNDRHRVKLFSNKKNEGVESMGHVDSNNDRNSHYFQKLADQEESHTENKSQSINSPKFKSITQEDADESSLNDENNEERNREELSQVPQYSAQNYDQMEDERESRSSQGDFQQNQELVHDEEQQDNEQANQEDIDAPQYEIEDENQPDSYLDQQLEDDNQPKHPYESGSHSEIEEEPETPGELNEHYQINQDYNENITEQEINETDENIDVEAERWPHDTNPEEDPSLRADSHNQYAQDEQSDEQPGMEEVEEEQSNEEQDYYYDNGPQGGYQNNRPDSQSRYPQKVEPNSNQSKINSHISDQFRKTIQQINLKYSQKNASEKQLGNGQHQQIQTLRQKSSQQNQGMMMANGAYKGGFDKNSSHQVQSARSPKKEQRLIGSRNPEYEEIDQPNQQNKAQDNKTILMLQAQVQALQEQIGMIIDSQQVDKQGPSPARKAQISSSEQKRRPRGEPEEDKFGSPKSCSQFDVGQQQSPKVRSAHKNDRIRPKFNENSSQDAPASTFGKATQNEQSLNPDQEEDYSQEGPRFGRNDEYDQEVSQEKFENEEEAQSIDQEEYADQIEDGPDTFNEQEQPIEEESEEEDLPVFGSQMKKNVKRAKQNFDLDGSPGSSSSQRMSRSKSPENPHINRISTEKSQYNDSQSDMHAYDNQRNDYGNHSYKRNFNQYKGQNSMMRHRSRSVDNEEDYEDETSNDKRQRRASDSGSYRQGSRSGGRNNGDDSQSDKLTFKNLSEFASIEIMKSNKQNVQEELKKREMKQLSKHQLARQEYLARQSNNQSQGSAVYRSQNVERGQPQSGSYGSRKERPGKEPQRYAKDPANQQYLAKRESQGPLPDQRQMRQGNNQVAAAPMGHRTSNRQLPPQYSKETGQGNNYSSSHQQSQIQHGSSNEMVQYLQNKYGNPRESNLATGSHDPRNGQGMAQQKQVRGQMTAQQIKQLQMRQQIRDSYNNKIGAGDEEQAQQYGQVVRVRNQSPSKNQNGVQNSEQKRAHMSGSQHPKSPGSVKKSMGQSAMRSQHNQENYYASRNMYAQGQSQERGVSSQVGNPQMSQSPRHPQSKQARPPQNYGTQNAQNSGNNVIKGAGSQVGANKRLMGPRQGDYYDREDEDYHGQRQPEYDGQAYGSMKQGASPSHNQYSSRSAKQPYNGSNPDHSHRIQKQLFQNDDRQNQSQMSSNQKKRPVSPRQSDLLPHGHRSRGSHPANYGAPRQNPGMMRQSSASKPGLPVGPVQNGSRMYKGGQY